MGQNWDTKKKTNDASKDEQNNLIGEKTAMPSAITIPFP